MSKLHGSPSESYQIARGAMWSLTCLSCGIWRQQSTSQFFSTVSGGNLPALPVESYLPYLVHHQVQGINWAQLSATVSSSQAPQQPTATSQPTSPSSQQPIPPSSLQRRREDPSPSTPHQPLPPPSPNSLTAQQLHPPGQFISHSDSDSDTA